MERSSLRQKLEELAEPEYREFSQKLVLDGLPMLCLLYTSQFALTGHPD